MAAGAALGRGLSVCLFEKKPAAGAQGAHHRQGALQRDQQLPCGGSGGRLPPGREVPLPGLFGLYPPGHHGLFRGPGGPPEDRAGPAGVPPSRTAPRTLPRPWPRWAAGARVVRQPVTQILLEGGEGPPGCQPPQGDVRGRAVLLCCGGASYPGTGSNGDGYKLAAAAGHTIVEPTPSLVPPGGAGPLVPEAHGPSPCGTWGSG